MDHIGEEDEFAVYSVLLMLLSGFVEEVILHSFFFFVFERSLSGDREQRNGIFFLNTATPTTAYDM